MSSFLQQPRSNALCRFSFTHFHRSRFWSCVSPPCQSVYVVFHMYFKQYPHRKWLDDQRPQKVNDILWLQATMLKAGPKISFLNLKVSNLRHYEKKLIFQLFQYLFIWSLLSSQFLDLDNFFIFLKSRTIYHLGTPMSKQRTETQLKLHN